MSVEQDLRDYAQEGRSEECRLMRTAADEIKELRGLLQEMVDMVAPTIRSEGRLSQGLSSALIRSRTKLRGMAIGAE